MPAFFVFAGDVELYSLNYDNNYLINSIGKSLF